MERATTGKHDLIAHLIAGTLDCRSIDADGNCTICGCAVERVSP